ncbi:MULTISPECIES: hypothetical protein [Halorussus]|uniref:hypothetical protein n=1 Tax=Halorussus TaxID=1070314 RepID=UPI000E217730|nr:MULTISPECIES: hypothetical protein [Halorussus]NHN59939.1 hypothetical protein [Halorussus sp. JP-T4]
MESDATDRGESRSRGLSLAWSLALAALVAVSPAYDLYEAGTVSWGWLAVGAVAWGTAVGPAAASSYGRRVGAWFRSVGAIGRALVIFGFAGAAWAFHAAVDPPAVAVDSFVLGGMVGLAAVALWREIRSG